MSSQSIIAIFPVAMVILWIGLWAVRTSGRTMTRRQLGWLLIGGILLTLGSLLIRTSGFAGTNHQVIFGWPHFFLTKTWAFDGHPSNWVWQIAWGPLGSYVWTNIIFYFAWLMLAVGLSWRYRKK